MPAERLVVAGIDAMAGDLALRVESWGMVRQGALS